MHIVSFCATCERRLKSGKKKRLGYKKKVVCSVMLKMLSLCEARKASSSLFRVENRVQNSYDTHLNSM